MKEESARSARMKQHQGVWFPDGEVHLCEWMTKSGELVDGRGTYQIRKLREALKWVKQWRVAVDVGAHVGLWSMQLEKRFEMIHAFEPVAAFRECFGRNVVSRKPVLLYPYAIGAKEGRVRMKINPADTGGTHVDAVTDAADASDDSVVLHPLDTFEMLDVDFLKIDCEGFELEVVTGARATLEKFHPVVIVEQKQHIMGRNYGTQGTPAVDFLLGLGAKQRAVISGDYILSWD